MQTEENHSCDLNHDEIARYARHISLKEIGLKGQKKLKASSVICIGTGGLGSPLLLYLAAAGIGHIGIVDFDLVESSNLQRQIIHGNSWIGKSKTSSACSRVHEINPFCKIDIFETLITKENIFEIIKSFDIVCDCTDNFASRYLINDACVILEKPNIYGSIAEFQGQVTVFNLNKKSPNLRDLIPEPPPEELIPSCSQTGVFGILPGLIGVIQATEVIKIITGIGNSLSGRLLVFDALSMKFKELKLTKNDEGIASIKELDIKKCSQKGNSSIKSISIKELKSLINNESNKIQIIDVRERIKYQQSSIPGATSIPLNMIEAEINNIKKISKTRLIYLYCQSGRRSAKAILKLKEYGIKGINISGGINAWDLEMKKKL